MINSLLKIIIVSFPLLFGCDKNKSEQLEKLKPIKTYSLKISEPSGLALTKGKLWIVSDRKSTVYQTDLKGKIEFSFKIKETDLEGITIFNDSLIAIVLEFSREVLILDLAGNEIFRTTIEIEGSRNSGLEGITYNPTNNHFFLINEKDPALLIETDKNLKEISRKKIKGVKDLSGISYSRKDDCLWLLSDEDRKIIKAHPLPLPEGKGNSDFKSPSLGEGFRMGAEYKINVEQPEGIAVDDENNLIYVVSDKEEKLYVFEMRPK